MRYKIHIDPACEEPFLDIHCRAVDKEVEGILLGLALTENTVTAQSENKAYFLPLRDVLYFESVDEHTFLYTADGTYECSLRLYQVEERLGRAGFVRISKSVVVSLWHMRCVRREKNRTLMTELSNGEWLKVSRTYLEEIRRRLLERSVEGGQS